MRKKLHRCFLVRSSQALTWWVWFKFSCSNSENNCWKPIACIILPSIKPHRESCLQHLIRKHRHWRCANWLLYNVRFNRLGFFLVSRSRSKLCSNANVYFRFFEMKSVFCDFRKTYAVLRLFFAMSRIILSAFSLRLAFSYFLPYLSNFMFILPVPNFPSKQFLAFVQEKQQLLSALKMPFFLTPF